MDFDTASLVSCFRYVSKVEQMCRQKLERQRHTNTYSQLYMHIYFHKKVNRDAYLYIFFFTKLIAINQLIYKISFIKYSVKSYNFMKSLKEDVIETFEKIFKGFSKYFNQQWLICG